MVYYNYCYELIWNMQYTVITVEYIEIASRLVAWTVWEDLDTTKNHLLDWKKRKT